MPDDDARPSRAAVIAPVGIVIGILMIVASFLVPHRPIGRANWSNAQASEYQQTALRLHELSHEAAEAADKSAKDAVAEELATARAKFDSIRSELDSATQLPQRFGAVLRWGGVLASAAGIVVYFVANAR